MIRVFLSSYGLRPIAQLFLFRTGFRKTFEEMFTKKVPEIDHFRIFGCLTYSHVPSEKRTKLEATGERSIFVGYDETSKAFRIYLPTQRKVVVRREVRYEEERAFKRSRDSEIEEQQSTPQRVRA